MIKIYDTIPEHVSANVDSFSQDLVYLWNARYMSGKIIVDEIEIPGKVCRGYILLQESKKDWTIRGFFVDQQCRNQGIGSALLDAVADLISKSKNKTCFVNITKGAENIYIRHGFEILGPRPDFPDQVRAIRKYSHD